MSSFLPKKPIHQGVIQAKAFLLDTETIGEAEVRNRGLALWQPGTRIYQVGHNILVDLPQLRKTVCATAPGLPLVEVDRRLIGFPVAAGEPAKQEWPLGAVVWLEGNSLRVERFSGEQLVDPALWVDVAGFTAVGTATLGAPPAKPKLVAEEAPFDPRQKFTGVPPEDPERAAIIAELLKAGRPAAAPRLAAAPPPASTGDSLGGMFETVTNSISDMVSSWFGGGSGGGGKSGESWFDRISGQFQRLTQKVVMATRLSQYIGQKQAEYLSNLMNMFEEGNLDDALRHAIPLNNLPDSLKTVPSYETNFQPRPNLSINPARNSSASSINLGNDTFSYLRKLYRAAFDRLVAQGKIEEAAFVLAELLLENEEAVAFLERHGKLQLAAEMAEARHLAPGLVVRQWFIAGDIQRAIAIARRTGAFADAILRLERTDRAAAEKLRLLWAGVQAEAGDFALAVETIWPIDSARKLAEAWIEQGIAVGGVGGAQMLVRKLELLPETFPAVRPQVLAMLAAEDKETVFQRQTLTERLTGGEGSTAKRTLARAAVRTVARDATNGFLHLTNETLDRYTQFTNDPVLRADLPKLPRQDAPVTLDRLREPMRYDFDTSDAGNLAVSDAALLPDGSLLVALGEAGLRRLSRKGKLLRHYDLPADTLVLSDVGNRALAIARRGPANRLTRLDLHSGKAEDWCDAEFHSWAGSFDGSLWFVGYREDVLAIDATARRFESIWRVPDIGTALSISRSAKKLAIVTGKEEWNHGGELELWNYAFPHLTLRNRDRTNPYAFGCHDRLVNVSPDGYVADLGFSPVGSDTFQNLWLRLWFCRTKEQSRELVTDVCTPCGLEISDHWIALAAKTIRGVEIRLFDLSEIRLRASWILAGASAAHISFRNQMCCCTDDRGRVVLVDVQTGDLLRNERITV